MKNKIFTSSILLLSVLMLFQSCNKEESISLRGVEDVSYEVGFGEIVFSWDIPKDDNIEYVRVSFNDEGEERLYSFSLYSEEKAVISGLDSKEYTFLIETADKLGKTSAPVTISATPLKPPYLIVGETLSIEPVVGGVSIAWENPTEKEVQINVDYLDEDGATKAFSVVSDESKSKRYILGVLADEQSFAFYASTPGNYLQISDVRTATLKPYLEIRFEDREDWTITDYSSVFNQDFPEKIFDNDLQTFWQTNWRAQDPYPHYVEFDMGVSRIITKLGFYNRDHNNANNAPTDFIVEGSQDGLEWELYGSYDDFPTTRKEEILYTLESTPNIRYMRITFDKPRNTVNFALAELYVYGANE